MSVILRERKLAKGGTSYHLDINNNGIRYTEFLKIHISKEDSKDVRKEKLLLIQSIKSQRELEIITQGSSYVPQHKRTVDFIKFYRHYIEDYQKRDKRMIVYSLEKFIQFIGKTSLRANELTPRLCEGFMDFLKSPKAALSGETPHNYFSRFKKVVKEAAKEDGILKINPTVDLRFKKGEDADNLKKNVLFEKELQALANTNCGNAEVKRAFLFACFTGLGLAEIKELKWQSIQNGRLITKRQKTGTSINIPLSNTATNLLGAVGDTNEYIFSLQISDVAISKDLKHWIKKAGIAKNISFYCGRHTFAVQLLMNGSNLKTVSDCMGHTTTKHTLKYLNFVDSLKDDAINKLPTLNLVA